MHTLFMIWQDRLKLKNNYEKQEKISLITNIENLTTITEKEEYLRNILIMQDIKKQDLLTTINVLSFPFPLNKILKEKENLDVYYTKVNEDFVMLHHKTATTSYETFLQNKDVKQTEGKCIECKVNDAEFGSYCRACYVRLLEENKPHRQ